MSRQIDPENNICAALTLCFGSPVTALRHAATRVARRLIHAGHETFFAGGCVRDALMGRVPKDYDLATSATPPEVLALFPGAGKVGAHFGVILVRHDECQFEVATFRRDGPYRDGRHPETVSYSTPEADAKRRDFTINGLFEDPRTGAIIDHVGGRRDIDRRLVRAIGDPRQRFEEDSLRLMRAVRFAVTTGFEIHPETWDAVCREASLLDRVSPERIREELDRILLHPDRRRGVELLVDSGLMAHVIPEFLALRGCDQPPEFHPEGDVYIHTLLALEALDEAPSIELALAVLLHDIAKPRTKAFDNNGRMRFLGHAAEGAAMTGEIMERLRFSNREIKLVATMIEHHLRPTQISQHGDLPTRRAVYRYFRDAGEAGIDIMFLSLADHLATRGPTLTTEGWREHTRIVDYVLSQQYEQDTVVAPPKLIDGDDLMNTFGLEPGPYIGELLEMVREAQASGALKTREEALSYVRKRLRNSTERK